MKQNPFEHKIRGFTCLSMRHLLHVTIDNTYAISTLLGLESQLNNNVDANYR